MVRRSKYRRRAWNSFLLDGNTKNSGGSPPHLTDNEFLKKYRMSRANFIKLLALIDNHPVFKNPPGSGRRMDSVSTQLMVFLACVGSLDSGGHKSRSQFSTGYGTHYKHCDRVAEAIGSLRSDVVKWPDADERRIIAGRFKKEYDFVNCVGMGDGTLFPLTYQPITDDAPDYSGRKHQYSLTCFIINDDKRRIRSYMAGWPGSVHDNRVFGNMRVNLLHSEHFTHKEYILSDSALENSNFVVSAFKKPPLRAMPTHKKRFNTRLATARIGAEHTIGILKGRFRWLKGINLKITEDKKSMLRILKFIDCCIIMHNLLIADHITDVEQSWIDEEDFSDIDDSNRVPGPYDMLERPLRPGCMKDERRSRLKAYFEFKEYVI